MRDDCRWEYTRAIDIVVHALSILNQLLDTVTDDRKMTLITRLFQVRASHSPVMHIVAYLNTG